MTSQNEISILDMFSIEILNNKAYHQFQSIFNFLVMGLIYFFLFANLNLCWSIDNKNISLLYKAVSRLSHALGTFFKFVMQNFLCI